jgi:ankyrin repeat protein
MRKAAHARNIELGQVLIDLGIAVDRCAHPQETIGLRPQHIAVSRGRPDFIRLLLDNKENSNVSDRLHQTPLDPAVGHAASRNHLGPANRSEAVDVTLGNNRFICDLLRSLTHKVKKRLPISSKKKWMQDSNPQEQFSP